MQPERLCARVAYCHLPATLLCLAISLYTPSADAQRPNAPGGGNQGGNNASSSASLSGLSWSRAGDWRFLSLPPDKNKVVACYVMKYAPSGTQPFVLQPPRKDEIDRFKVNCNTRTDKNHSGDTRNPKVELTGDYPPERDQCRAIARENDKLKSANSDAVTQPLQFNPCSDLTAEHPVLMGQTLVIGIDTTDVQTDRIQLFNLNVTTQAGSAINPTPIRPSFAASAANVQNLGSGVYFLPWPNAIPGDTIPTVSVNVVYTPPAPGDVWTKNTFYAPGAIIYSPTGDGHYYVAKTGGVSAVFDTPLPSLLNAPAAQVRDGQATWLDVGNTAPQGGGGGGAPGANPTTLWLPHHPYPTPSTVFDPYNGHYYTNFAPPIPCVPAGCTPSPTTSGFAPTDPFSVPTVFDGTVEWADRGDAPPPGGTLVAPRQASTSYASGAWVRQDALSHYFHAVQTNNGITSDSTFVLPSNPIIPAVSDGGIAWRDAGTNPPAPRIWVTKTVYAVGDWVKAPDNQYYFCSHGGKSITSPDQPPSDVNDVATWESYGPNPPSPPAWKTQTPYQTGSWVIAASNGHYYIAMNKGTSGPVPTQPYFATTTVRAVTEDATPSQAALQLRWEDLGTSTPTQVANGQPPDQTLSVLNLQLAQSHSLSYFNLAAGIARSNVRTRTYAFSGSPITANSPVIQTGGTRNVEPILLLTAYPLPIDAEAHCALHCLWTTWPGLSVGLSLSNPSSSFYAGVSLELIRNVQLVAGENWSKINVPASGAAQGMSAINSGTPATVQRFSSGAFVGLTFNFTGFIQGLFGGGGGGGSKSSTSSSSGSSSSN